MSDNNLSPMNPAQGNSSSPKPPAPKPCLKCLFFPMRLQEMDLLLQDALAEIERHLTHGIRIFLRIFNVLREKTQESRQLADELYLQGLENGECLLRKIQQICLNLDCIRERTIRHQIPGAVCLLHCSRCLLTVVRYEWCDFTLENSFHQFLISASPLFRLDPINAVKRPPDPFAWNRVQAQARAAQFDLDSLLILYHLNTGTVEDTMGKILQSLCDDFEEINCACVYRHALHLTDCIDRFRRNLVKLYV